MPEFKSSPGLEQEIAQIERDLESKKEALKKQQEGGQIAEIPHEKETLKEVLGEKFKYKPPISPTEPPAVGKPMPSPPVISEPPSYLSDELKGKVQELVNVAFDSSIDDAIKKAKETHNPALIDAFHDALIDELYNYLLERGKLRKF